MNVSLDLGQVEEKHYLYGFYVLIDCFDEIYIKCTNTFKIITFIQSNFELVPGSLNHIQLKVFPQLVHNETDFSSEGR